jgi:hypothetical protein
MTSDDVVSVWFLLLERTLSCMSVCTLVLAVVVALIIPDVVYVWMLRLLCDAKLDLSGRCCMIEYAI